MMIPRQLIPAAASLYAASVLAACSSSALPSAPQGSAPAATAAHRKMNRVAVRVLIPRGHHRGSRSMRPFFVASSTRGIAVIASIHGTSTPVSTTNASVAAGSPLCKTVTAGRQCTITASAPAGGDDFVIKTYDAAPAGGGFSGAKQLAIGSTSKTVDTGKANSLNVTVGGVVASAAVNLSWPVNPVIDKDTQTVTVSALDADGNTIVNDGWYSAAGNPVTMALSASNGNTGTFAFAPTSISFAAPTSTLTYDSTTATPAQVQSGFTSTVSATPDNGGTAGTAVFTLSKPSFTEFAISTASSFPQGIAVGPDNASIWFAENGGSAIGHIATNAAAGTHPDEYGTANGMTGGAGPVGIAVAHDDHKLWFTESGIGKVASIDPTSHTITEYATTSASDTPYGITAGPDGNMWFTEQSGSHSKIGKFNASALDGSVGTISEFNTNTTGSGPSWIASGPDGNLWFTECFVDKIGTITTAGTGANDFAVASNSIGEGQITSGPDGALWFTEENPNSGHAIGRSTTGGSITLPHTFANVSTSAMGIVTGPDGALWFAENGNNPIGRIDASTHTVIEFSLPNSASSPWGIIKVPDGALWFTEYDGNRIGKLQ